MPAAVILSRRRLPLSDLTRLSTVGLRTRKLRAGLSALGIAIGVAAIVAVLGLSSSSQAGLLNEINQLGTNLLTVSNGAECHRRPRRAANHGASHDRPDQRRPAGADHRDGQRRQRLPQPLHPLRRHQRPDRPSRIPRPPPGGRHQRRPGPLPQRGNRQRTRRCPRRRRRAAPRDRPLYPGERIWVGGQWLYVVGILRPTVLVSAIDSSVLVGYPAAEKYLGFDGHPSTIYVRAQNDRVTAVDNLLGATANPENPSGVNVSQPSDVLVAQADAKSALNGLFLGLGAVALFVGAVGVANIMIISVLERRSEIGLRRALGASKGHIRTQFLSEAVLLGLLGGVVGVALGVVSTAVYAHTKGWATVVPPEAWLGGFAASLIIGAVAGLMPALRAARMSPTQALWSM